MTVTEAFPRFFTKLREADGGCWIWTAYKNSQGYGVHHLRGHGLMQAHRASWIIHGGEIPRGMLVLHKCDNPSCVNPDHLFVGTQKDNMDDCKAKGRMRKAYGERASKSKLTESQVVAIFRDRRTNVAIAGDYPVNNRTVSMIKNKKIWKHVTLTLA